MSHEDPESPYRTPQGNGDISCHDSWSAGSRCHFSGGTRCGQLIKIYFISFFMYRFTTEFLRAESRLPAVWVVLVLLYDLLRFGAFHGVVLL
jgi:hypothetical protein